MTNLVEQLEIDGEDLAHALLKWLDLREPVWYSNVIHVDVDWASNRVVVVSDADAHWSLRTTVDDFRDQLMEARRQGR